MSLLTETTDLSLAIDALTARDRLLHAVMVGTAQLIAGESIELGMSTGLRTVGEAIRVDRVLVMENVDGAHAPPILRYAWQSPDCAVLMNQEILVGSKIEDVDAVLTWLGPLQEGKSITTYLRSAPDAVRVLFDRMQNKSMLLMPIVMHGNLWGTICIDECKYEREWTPTEIDVLGTFAEIISIVILRNSVQQALQKSEERFRAVGETVTDAIIIINAASRIRYWNRAAERMLGYLADEAMDQHIHHWLVPARYRDKALQGMREFVATGHGPIIGKTLEWTAIRKDGVEIPVELAVNSMTMGGERYAVGVLRDISDRKRAEAQINRMARHDVLTGLANRGVFVEMLEQAISRTRRGGPGFAVLYLDLDHFKDVNDTLGHPIGDILLQEVAQRLRSNIRESDVASRFGGDEFAVIEIEIREPADAGMLADKLSKALNSPFTIQGNVIRSAVSIGIAVFGAESGDAETLLSHADVALYRAKAEGRGTYRFFTDSMDTEVRMRVLMVAELREAIASGQLFLVYQPQVDAPSGCIIGIEALVRWLHPTRGLVLPDEFIPAAETSGLIIALGQWVLREACLQMKEWLDAGLTGAVMAVNVSGLQFKRPLELETFLLDMLRETGLPPQHLEIELTESVLMEAARKHNDLLLAFRKAGMRIAIDDFGTGYSSLDYLRRFPVDRIKIAQSFLIDLTPTSGGAVIVKAAIGIAHALNIRVVVEGVETREHMLLISSWGCAEMQGYYFSRPLPAAEMTAVLRIGKIIPQAAGLASLAGASKAPGELINGATPP